jgi:hypothetical protein
MHGLAKPKKDFSYLVFQQARIEKRPFDDRYNFYFQNPLAAKSLAPSLLPTQ